MKPILLMGGILCLSGLCAPSWAEPPQAEDQAFVIQDFAAVELQKMGVVPVIVAAVKQANAEHKTLDEIKARDQAWRDAPGITAFMQAMLMSKCGLYLQQLRQSSAFYAEIFVMDNQGANVCMTDKTSDYWQGDEAKFQQSFLNGVGAIHIGEIAFDDSTHTYLVQVSVPVKAGDAVIGAITFGIDVEEID